MLRSCCALNEAVLQGTTCFREGRPARQLSAAACYAARGGVWMTESAQENQHRGLPVASCVFPASRIGAASVVTSTHKCRSAPDSEWQRV